MKRVNFTVLFDASGQFFVKHFYDIYVISDVFIKNVLNCFSASPAGFASI